MTKDRKRKLQQLVRAAIQYAIHDDLENNELIMKEVFEQCEDGEEFEEVYAEMRRIIAVIGYMQ